MVSGTIDVGGLEYASARNAVQMIDFEVERMRADPAPMSTGPEVRTWAEGKEALRFWVANITVPPGGTETETAEASLHATAPVSSKTSTLTWIGANATEVH